MLDEGGPPASQADAARCRQPRKPLPPPGGRNILLRVLPQGRWWAAATGHGTRLPRFPALPVPRKRGRVRNVSRISTCVEEQLRLIDSVGEQNYLQAQIGEEPGKQEPTAPACKPSSPGAVSLCRLQKSFLTCK
jgi:hypothetical protein